MVCPSCGNKQHVIKLLEGLPLASAMLTSKPVKSNDCNWVAGICHECQHISNVEAKDIFYASENYQVKSIASNAMSKLLNEIFEYISKLINKKSNILEIGSGSGELARSLALTHRVETVDPAVTVDISGVTHHWTQLFDSNFPGSNYDLIIARHVIEHVKNPKDFLKNIVDRLNKNGRIYLEIPSLEATLDSLRIMDFFHDHIHYFSKISLSRIANELGLELIYEYSLLNGLHIGYVFELTNQKQVLSSKSRNIVQLLAESKFKFKLILEEIDKSSGQILLYGAGAHASTFTSQLNDHQAKKIYQIWDRSIHKQGLYLPNVSVPISLPKKGINPTLIINSAILYTSEIKKYLNNELELECKIIDL